MIMKEEMLIAEMLKKIKKQELSTSEHSTVLQVRQERSATIEFFLQSKPSTVIFLV